MFQKMSCFTTIHSVLTSTFQPQSACHAIWQTVEIPFLMRTTDGGQNADVRKT